LINWAKGSHCPRAI